MARALSPVTGARAGAAGAESGAVAVTYGIADALSFAAVAFDALGDLTRVKITRTR